MAQCRNGIVAVRERPLLHGVVPNGFYTLNPFLAVATTCSLPLFAVDGMDDVPTVVDGFYLFAPHDKDCRPDDGSGGGGGIVPPDGGFMPCGKRIRH